MDVLPFRCFTVLPAFPTNPSFDKHIEGIAGSHFESRSVVFRRGQEQLHPLGSSPRINSGPDQPISEGGGNFTIANDQACYIQGEKLAGTFVMVGRVRTNTLNSREDATGTNTYLVRGIILSQYHKLHPLSGAHRRGINLDIC